MPLRRKEERKPAFDLARKMHDPRFRVFIKRNGYRSGTTVLVALDAEPATEVFSRIRAETKPPVVVAIPRESAEFGFVFMTIGGTEYGPAAETVNDDEPEIGDAASIGMLYDAMAARHRHTGGNFVVVGVSGLGVGTTSR
ncbi:hypothetical protein AWW66_10015 [Micromonospora rosaria]|uniref:Uncharacterized protein n=1 Tax=Micromonospora rosaria TaxID=47874 RepID=A0A136PUC1_9ACTN|nr:hypothetical protein [Micromonospora rosaria]KXK62079.1 hypothetical protein AWW66_10015 [Micromonospora rosaria]